MSCKQFSVHRVGLARGSNTWGAFSRISVNRWEGIVLGLQLETVHLWFPAKTSLFLQFVAVRLRQVERRS